MAILNYFCEGCTKVGVCSWNQVIDRFSEEKKKPLGVTIEIKTCDEYESVIGESDSESEE